MMACQYPFCHGDIPCLTGSGCSAPVTSPDIWPFSASDSAGPPEGPGDTTTPSTAPSTGSSETASETILEEAAQITATDRNYYYGHPLDNHTRSAALWTAYLQGRYPMYPIEITPEDICWMNILQKIAREMNHPKRDNLVDTAGWARNIEMIQDERAKRDRDWRADDE